MKKKGDIELPSLGRVQTKTCRGGEERAPIADELSRNHLDQALGPAGLSDGKEGRREERLKLQGLDITPVIGEYPVLAFPIKPEFKRDSHEMVIVQQLA
jgi:hypothetical protein